MKFFEWPLLFDQGESKSKLILEEEKDAAKKAAHFEDRFVHRYIRHLIGVHDIQVK
jgi:hypothetical protein